MKGTSTCLGLFLKTFGNVAVWYPLSFTIEFDCKKLVWQRYNCETFLIVLAPASKRHVPTYVHLSQCTQLLLHLLKRKCQLQNEITYLWSGLEVQTGKKGHQLNLVSQLVHTTTSMYDDFMKLRMLIGRFKSIQYYEHSVYKIS